MKETLETLAARMDNLGARMDRFSERVDLRFKHLEERFDRMDERFEGRSKKSDERLDKVDKRLQEIDQRFQEVNFQLTRLAVGQDDLREDLKRSLDGYGSLADKDKANVNDHERLHDVLDSHHLRITVLETSGTRPLDGGELPLRSGPALVSREKGGNTPR